MEKWTILDQNNGPTLLQKSQFFEFSNFLFLQPKRRFFLLKYRRTHFRGLYCLKYKREKWPILDQNHGLNLLQKSQFFDFLNFLFLYPRKAFFRSTIL